METNVRKKRPVSRPAESAHERQEQLMLLFVFANVQYVRNYI